MGTQSGALKIRATLDDINFYKRGDRYFVRLKGGVHANRLKTDPAYQRSRENMAEFGRAIAAGKLLRESILPLLKRAQDPRVSNRLVSVLMRVVKSDTISARGNRTAGRGAVPLLEGFEFNKDTLLTETLGIGVSSMINRASGTLTLDVPAFIPGQTMSAAPGATHYKIVSAGVAIDFDGSAQETDLKESVALPINNMLTLPLQLVAMVSGGTTLPLLQIAGVQFLQEINGVLYPLHNSAYNALKLVKVDV